MPLFSSSANVGSVTQTLTYDPFQPEEIGRTSMAADDSAVEEILAVGAPLIIRNPGLGYSAGTNVATTNVTAANNDYVPVAANPGAGLTVDVTINEDGSVASAVVNTAPTTTYDSGAEVTINGNTGGQPDCVLLIPYK